MVPADVALQSTERVTQPRAAPPAASSGAATPPPLGAGSAAELGHAAARRPPPRTERMTSEIDALRRFFAAVDRNDMPAMTSDFDPRTVRVAPEGFPTARTYRGIVAREWRRDVAGAA